MPIFLKPYFWSYDINTLDKERDKKRIITNILNLGNKEATSWLFLNYSKREIGELIENPLPGEWNKKSLNYWALLFNIPIENKNRCIKFERKRLVAENILN